MVFRPNPAVFPNSSFSQTSPWLTRLSKAGCPPQRTHCGWASSNWLRVWMEQNCEGRENLPFSAWPIELGRWPSPALQLGFTCWLFRSLGPPNSDWLTPEASLGLQLMSNYLYISYWSCVSEEPWRLHWLFCCPLNIPQSNPLQKKT